MARTAALKPEHVPADSKPTLDAFTKNIGFTPNMMAAFAQSPIAFNAWATLLGSLSKALDVKTRDSIGLAVSELNGCNYCRRLERRPEGRCQEASETAPDLGDPLLP